MPRASSSPAGRPVADAVEKDEEESHVLVIPDDTAVARRVRVSQVVGKNAGASDGSLVLITEKGHPERRKVAVCSIVGKLKGAKVYCPAWMGFEKVQVSKFRQDFEGLSEVQLTCEDTHLGEVCGEQLPKEMVNYLSRCIAGYVLSPDDDVAVVINGRVTRFSTKHGSTGWGLVTADTHLKVELSKEKVKSEEQKVRGFDRVGGLAGTIQEIVSCMEGPLCNPGKYAKFGVTPPRGVLLYGPPGTGKSLLASAVAEELQAAGTPIHVELVKSTELTTKGEAAVHSLFGRCRESGQAALIFIDEVDAVCPDREGRGSSTGTEAERRMVASLLTEMDGAGLPSQGSNPPLVVLGATNRPNAIDPAARRAGRFELEVSVGVPDESGRKDILEVILRREFPKAVQDSLRPSLDEVARKTHGFVGADLKALLSRACALAMNEGSTAGVGLRHVVEAQKYIKPSALKELIVEVARTRWSDIGGYEDVKRRLVEAVVWPLTHGDLFAQMGVAPPRGILLYGPPGCSKTMLARAVATETEMNFISIKGPELFSKWVGDSEAKVRDLFRKARQAAPTVVFIDEVDAIGQERATGGGGVADRVLAQLLTELDGVGGQSGAGVVLIAATNRPWAMDPALLRPGRIDRLVHVPLPDDDARREIWKGALGKVPHATVSDGDDDIEHFVSATKGYSGAEIVAVVREGCMAAVRREIDHHGSGEMTLTRSLIDEGLSRVQPRITEELAQAYVEYAEKQSSGAGRG
ncbi:Spermatoproteinsis associated protein 5 [Perkinsus olseni]|uniref:Spermatoproteinsis associated protein 5 n=1 Tax=Perkinsus olseni TaxID=32597 RepID=A0A7J6L8T8_PEROL|nr:Spermatoproteinsis associated protein 5 [Perkinsus olseni]KAF4658970.1 Spermatoproteinsis associated protein 5 [Perkinsus olseni]